MTRILPVYREFIYLISSTGITGERSEFATNLKECVKQIKAIKNVLNNKLQNNQIIQEYENTISHKINSKKL